MDNGSNQICQGFKDLVPHASNQTELLWFSERARMWSVVVSITALVLVVEGQKRPTISFISGAGSGEVVTDLGKSAELICQVLFPTDLITMQMPIQMLKINITTGETSPAITPFHLFGYSFASN